MPELTTLPGATPFSDATHTLLLQALKNKGSDYQPRTQHLTTAGLPQYTNRLLLEPSPYLQQHAHNPVNWYPWGEEAFLMAKKLNRPVLLSIGYSTCHWCHVMEEESYDNPEIAQYLNQHFIAIKVDRELRPDIDAIYMRAVQTMTGHGGWPLNVFLLPNKQAFFGGTYFPPEDRQGRKGLKTVLSSISEVFHQQPQKVANYAGQLTTAIQNQMQSVSPEMVPQLDKTAIDTTLAYFKDNIDPFSGGIGKGVKFPSSTPLRLLMRQYHHQPDPALKEQITLTLDKMAEGGIYDQLGGGFHRYSTDPQWRVPHFEKMLYDNAQLTMVYLEAFQLFADPYYREIVIDTLDYVLREMTASIGGFYSATDADSRNAQQEMEEGWFFTWMPEELSKTLTLAQLSLISDWFGVTAQGELDGRNVLYRPYKQQDYVLRHDIDLTTFTRTLADAKNRLLKARSKRAAPLRDDKIITAWNGLMIAVFAKAGIVLNRPDYLLAGQNAADFVLTKLIQNHRLQRIYLDGKTQGPAFLNDYAFFINALIELYQADSNPKWLNEAKNLQKLQDSLYRDNKDGVYYKTANDSEQLLFRDKPLQDGVLPSGNSMTAYNLLRLYNLSGDEIFYQRGMQLLQAAKPQIDNNPLAMTDMLIALDFALAKGKEVVLVLAENADNSEIMQQVLRSTYIPDHVYLLTKEQNILKTKNISPLLDAKRSLKGKTTAYVCKNKVCKLPVTDPVAFVQQLQ